MEIHLLNPALKCGPVPSLFPPYELWAGRPFAVKKRWQTLYIYIWPIFLGGAHTFRFLLHVTVQRSTAGTSRTPPYNTLLHATAGWVDGPSPGCSVALCAIETSRALSAPPPGAYVWPASCARGVRAPDQGQRGTRKLWPTHDLRPSPCWAAIVCCAFWTMT